MTTSLPEQLGGVRNWDYRYCWLRDATLTLNSMLSLGFDDEARAWRDWLLRAVAGDPRDMQIMYGCAGERRLTELELPWLAGLRGLAAGADRQRGLRAVPARRLRRGHGLADPRARGGHRSRRARLGACSSGSSTSSSPTGSEPDEGLWEVRGPRRHFVHSKVMAWVAFDRAVDDGRAVRAARRRRLAGAASATRSTARCARRAGTSERGTFTQSYGSRALDAALLLIPRTGFLPGDDPRVRRHDRGRRSASSTTTASCCAIPTDEADDGLPPGEGAFLPCSSGSPTRSRCRPPRRGARALRPPGRPRQRRRPVRRGVRPEAGRMVGNFPQAFTHLALVNTALTV